MWFGMLSSVILLYETAFYIGECGFCRCKGSHEKLRRGKVKLKRHGMSSKKCWKYVVIFFPQIILLYIEIICFVSFSWSWLKFLVRCYLPPTAEAVGRFTDENLFQTE
ncbi:hypothetical protein COP2_027800 [Malus domestica]